MADLDSIADSISDDANFDDLISGREVEQAEVQPEAELAQEPETELLDEPSSQDEEYVAEAESETPEPSSEPELVERDWYGKKVKLDKEADEYINSYFTRKNQEIAEERKRVQEETQKAIQEAQRLREEAYERQRQLQAHLDANPEFAESWNYEQQVAQRNKEFETMRAEFQTLQQSLEQERMQRQFEQEVSSAKETYQLNEKAPISEKDAMDIALSQVISSNGNVPFTQAWQDVVGRYNRNVKSEGIKQVKNALEKQGKNTGLTSKRSAQARTKPGKKLSIDEMLERDLARPDHFYER